jgi:hypothetical protein
LPFQLHISDAEQAYLDGLPLSPEAKERLRRFIDQTIADIPDAFRLDPENRPKADSPYFLVQHLLLDRWGDGGIHRIDFHIRDDKAEYGVLLVVFIDRH